LLDIVIIATPLLTLITVVGALFIVAPVGAIIVILLTEALFDLSVTYIL
jgi:hypothetical protein